MHLLLYPIPNTPHWQALAVALYSGRFWPVSAALVAKAMGATIAGLCSRGSSFTTASALRSAAQYSTICTAVRALGAGSGAGCCAAAVKDCIRDGGSTNAMDARNGAGTFGIRDSARSTRRLSSQERRIDALLRAQPVLASQATAEEVRAWCRSALIGLIDSGVDGNEASFAVKLARRKRKASILHGWNDDDARATKDRPGKEFPNRPSWSGRTSSIASSHRRTLSASSSTDPSPLSQADQETSAHAASAEARGSGTTLRYPAPKAGEDRPPDAVYRPCMTWSGECGGAVISETNAAAVRAGAGAGATLRDPRQGRIGIPRRLPRLGPDTVHV